eukprot:CAMPEP_0117654216 /NCGR_PEP_ID=MMETSP0804-20121206/3625_1 /TAXON_ID=1074897 /ORGANISM="Tetraselmis astigmatica, Strain CCMP880" /LENGTH=502 /DNA_ID=CAMNT_0005460481 /DNA_START=30 /DNA_END=1538 /DNA_ORIENTATION=-
MFSHGVAASPGSAAWHQGRQRHGTVEHNTRRAAALRVKPSRCIAASAAVPEDRFDVCVVGNGMVGAAAARYLAAAGLKVAAIGPAEPPRSSWGGIEVFGAHYDEGRITRKTDPDPVWAELAQRSISRYLAMQQESGVQFYREVGHLAVGPAGSSSITERLWHASKAGVEHSHLDEQQLLAGFPYFRFPSGSHGIHERTGAGWISARRNVEAQLALARKHGCCVVPEEVLAVERGPGGDRAQLEASPSGTEAYHYIIRTQSSTFRTDKVGAFTNFRPLLPAGPAGSHIPLDLQLMTAQTVKVQVAPADARRLEDMPSVIYTGEDCWCYILPPILYPNGNTYIKIGGGCSKTPAPHIAGREAREVRLPGKYMVHSHEEVVEWYRSGGDPQATRDLLELLHSILPGLSPPLSWHSDACITCHTPTGLPYIGAIGKGDKADGLIVATGGNGVAAKSADELGRLACEAAMGRLSGQSQETPAGRQQALGSCGCLTPLVVSPDVVAEG